MQRSTWSAWKNGARLVLQKIQKERKWQIGAGAVVVCVIALVVIVVSIKQQATALPAPVVANTNTQEPELPSDALVHRVIDGVKVEQGKENLLPVAVMIENLVTIRPQAGLQNAQVVYEALAEGGITRFMAVYASGDAIAEIGPVRSARKYFVDWAEEYRSMYVHAGGSPNALQQLATSSLLLEDLNQISGDHPYFWRDSSIPAPHNLFTSSELLAYALRDKAFQEKVGEYDGWKFTSASEKKDRPEEERFIALQYYSSSYHVRYAYDRETNTYLRFQGDQPHTDRLTNEQIRVKNVAVQFIPTSLLEESSGRLDVETIGEGKAIIFRDGLTFVGTWKKETAEERTRFFTEDGKEVEFIPGNIWIQVAPDDRVIEYQ